MAQFTDVKSLHLRGHSEKAQLVLTECNTPSEIASLQRVTIRRSDNYLLREITWTVSTGEHWVVLGPNGSGKSTLLMALYGEIYPSSGTVTLLGEQLGRTDLAQLRKSIGRVLPSVRDFLRSSILVNELVLAMASGHLEYWWSSPTQETIERTTNLLELWNLSGCAQRPISTLSSGEFRRLELALSLINTPALLLLDEPFANLDLGLREDILSYIDLIQSRTSYLQASVVVLHHLEEISPNTTHVLLLSNGEIVDKGPKDKILTSEAITRCFGREIEVAKHGSRYSAHSQLTDPLTSSIPQDPSPSWGTIHGS